MEVIATPLAGVKLVKPKVHGDSRGFFVENWNIDRYREQGIDLDVVQVNTSRSSHGVLRGLHYQNPNPQGKLVWASAGEVFDVAVDIRRNSPTFGQWYGAYLSVDNGHQLWIPPGLAHGFAVTGQTALFCYLCTSLYDAVLDTGIAWNDPDLAIEWPLDNPSLSAKDQQLPRLADTTNLPQYR